MSKKKRILLILADQFRSELMGCRNHPLIKTPNLDALANEGVLFQNFFCVTAPCGPSRMSIFTGRHACSTGAACNMTPLRDAQENVAQYLTSAGIQSYFMGYNDYAYDQRILEDDHPKKGIRSYDNVLPGFETVLYHEYDSEAYFESLRAKGYPEELLNGKSIHAPKIPDAGCDGHIERSFPAHYTSADSECRFLSEQAIDFFQQHNSNDPSSPDSSWFLSLNYIKPHPPHICSDPYHEMYQPAEMPAPIRTPQELNPQHPFLQKINPQSLIDEQQQRELNAIYYGMISELDESLGVLFDGMKQAGVWDDTIIIFSSDHGEYMGDHYLEGKGGFYDQSMHIPCIIRDPSATQQHGNQCTGLAESIDICPTILDYADISIPKHIQGTSLKTVIDGSIPSTTKNEIHHQWIRPQRAGESSDDHAYKNTLWVIRDHHWKYVHFSDPDTPALLFDLETDPQEFNDLAADPQHQSTLLTYAQKMLTWRMLNEDRRMMHQIENFSYKNIATLSSDNTKRSTRQLF